jgi:hypothetical protein
MPISTESRYNDDVLLANEVNGKTRVEIKVKFPAARIVSYSYYRFSDGDRPDTLAANLIGNANLWWMIAEANPEIMNWHEVAVGTIIRIPSG